MDSELMFEFIMQIVEQYPIVGDIIFWFGIVWLIMCLILNIIDFFAGVFKWKLDNKIIVVLRTFCEKCGPSLSMFGSWARRRQNKP